jgi:hypothetical protein
MNMQGTLEQWRIVFLMMGSVFVAGATWFLITGRAELQVHLFVVVDEFYTPK